jgi:hypothetical protein
MRLLSTSILLASLAASSSAVAGTERDHRAPSYTPDSSVRKYRKRPGPRIMMPLKIDIGAAGSDTSRGLATGIGAAVGIHWASLAPRPASTDIGIGLFGALLGAPASDDPMMTKDAVAYGGLYLEAGHTLARGTWWRTWATGRGEYLGSTAFGNDHAGFGGTGRLSAELYVSGVGIAPRGVFLGTYAIGVYLEAGVRDVSSDLGMVHVGAGLTFRTPLVFAF